MVTKIPRFAFEKFPDTEPLLTTSMKSVGEVMAIGRTFPEGLQKALRSLETGLTGLNEVDIPGVSAADQKDAIIAALSQPRPDRILVIAQAFRHGLEVAEIHARCHYDPWFLEQIKAIVAAEANVRANGLPIDAPGLRRLKATGFSDQRLAELSGKTDTETAFRRMVLDVHPVYKRIDTCGAEFSSRTPYLYSCYEGDGVSPPECEADPSPRDKVVILGGGPNRIGQGIEFDYCCCHAAFALREAGWETIMVNCNPETVSTDYDTSDRLYFEPLTAEDVAALIRREQSRGRLLGVIVQLGGQTPLKLSQALEKAGIPILGTSPDAIDLAEDRERFQIFLQRLALRQPANGTARSVAEARIVAARIGYPVVLRPSYVLGGRAMRIVYGEEALNGYMTHAVKASGDDPVLIDHYLENAIEMDVDALADGKDVYVAGIMQHIEEAGIHSGDSACTLPPYNLRPAMIEEIKRQTRLLARELRVVGLMNVQFAIKDDVLYVLEVNPRASRTVPFVAKATGVPVAKIAARVMAGEALASFDLAEKIPAHVAVKEAVFPFARFPNVDTILGPEMKSTGEVMGIDVDFRRAFAKSQLGAGTHLPTSGTVFLSVKDRDKPELAELAQRLVGLGFKLAGTRGTARYL
ncbi:MAG: carbamoyl-phosphate synthase large subunit, partial [Rhodospirillaceae bacterium]